MAQRTRLSAVQRRDQIMDVATEVILDRGLANCTLDVVAQAAKISKALIYKHFANLEALLRALLEREYERLRPDQDPFERPGRSFAQRLGSGNRRAFQYLHDRGPLLRTLFSERASAELLGEQDREQRFEMTRRYAARITETYGVSPEVAFMGTLLTINAPSAATKSLKRFGVPPDIAADFWTTFILGGWAAASARYGARELGLVAEDKE